MKGLVRTKKGKGIPLIKRVFQTHSQYRKALLDDSAVEDLLILAYSLGRDDIFNGVTPCRTGFETAQRVKELL